MRSMPELEKPPPTPASSRAHRRADLKHMLQPLFSTPPVHYKLFESKASQYLVPAVGSKLFEGILWVVGVSVAVGLYHMYAEPKGWPGFSRQPLAAAAMSATITFALSLLLVFKTNSAYARWWEARAAWGQVVNFARNYSRQALLWLPGDAVCLRAFALRWAGAAPHILRCYVQEGHDMTEELQGCLTSEEVEWLLTWQNPCSAAAAAMAEAISAGHLRPEFAWAMQQEVSLFVNMAGACERIFRTPIPPAYTRHTSRFLMIYLTVAPLVLWPATGWATPFAAGMLAFLLLGVENIGVQIEEPCSVLPLMAICRSIATNLQEMQVQDGSARRILLASTALSSPLGSNTELQRLLTPSATSPRSAPAQHSREPQPAGAASATESQDALDAQPLLPQQPPAYLLHQPLTEVQMALLPGLDGTRVLVPPARLDSLACWQDGSDVPLSFHPLNEPLARVEGIHGTPAQLQLQYPEAGNGAGMLSCHLSAAFKMDSDAGGCVERHTWHVASPRVLARAATHIGTVPTPSIMVAAASVAGPGATPPRILTRPAGAPVPRGLGESSVQVGMGAATAGRAAPMARAGSAPVSHHPLRQDLL